MAAKAAGLSLEDENVTGGEHVVVGEYVVGNKDVVDGEHRAGGEPVASAGHVTNGEHPEHDELVRGGDHLGDDGLMTHGERLGGVQNVMGGDHASGCKHGAARGSPRRSVGCSGHCTLRTCADPRRAGAAPRAACRALLVAQMECIARGMVAAVSDLSHEMVVQTARQYVAWLVG